MDEDSFATPNPQSKSRTRSPHINDPTTTSLSKHAKRISEHKQAWILPSRPPVQTPVVGSSRPKPLRLAQSEGFKSSRTVPKETSSAIGGSEKKLPEAVGDWALGRTGYRTERESPLVHLNKNRALYPLEASSTPAPSTRRPVGGLLGDDEADGMFSLSRPRPKDRRKANQVGPTGLGPMFDTDEVRYETHERTQEDVVLDSQDEGEDVFSLPSLSRGLGIGARGGDGTRNVSGSAQRKTQRMVVSPSPSSEPESDAEPEAELPEEMQESIMFIRQSKPFKPTSVDQTKSTGPPAKPWEKRVNPGQAIQTKLPIFLKPGLPVPLASTSGRTAIRDPSTGRGRTRSTPSEPPLFPPPVLPSEKQSEKNRKTILISRRGARRAEVEPETQDMVPDSQTLAMEEAVWAAMLKPSVSGTEGDDMRDTRGLQDHTKHPEVIELEDESLPRRSGKGNTRRAATTETRTINGNHAEERSSTHGSDAESETEDFTYLQDLPPSTSKRHINRTSALADDDESYRPAGMLPGGRPVGRLLPIRSRLRDMYQLVERNASSEDLTDVEDETSQGQDALTEAARAATERNKLDRTTSGASSRTSVTTKLFGGSSPLTSLIGSDSQEGPEFLEIPKVSGLRRESSDLRKEMVIHEEDGDDDATPRRVSTRARRFQRIESQETSTCPNLGDVDQIFPRSATPEEAATTLGDHEGQAAAEDIEFSSLSRSWQPEETMPATFLMDEPMFGSGGDEFEATTLPETVQPELHQSLLIDAEGVDWEEQTIEITENSKQDRLVGPTGQLTPSQYTFSCELCSPADRTPIVVDHSMIASVNRNIRSIDDESAFQKVMPKETVLPDAPTTPHRVSAQVILTPTSSRTPRRKPLRTEGFAVPIIGGLRTPILPSPKKILIRTPRSPQTPSKITPRRSGFSPRSGSSTPGKREDWLDQVETLATWSPAKYESYYPLDDNSLRGSTMSRQVFEQSLRRELPLEKPIVVTVNPIEGITKTKEDPSSDLGFGSDQSGGKDSDMSNTSSARKRKLPGSEDNTIPGTFQNSGPSWRLLQSVQPGTSKRQRMSSLSDSRGSDVSTLMTQQIRKALRRHPPSSKDTLTVSDTTPKVTPDLPLPGPSRPILDARNPLSTGVQVDSSLTNLAGKTTKPGQSTFTAVEDAWAGLANDDTVSGKSQARLTGRKFRDGKEQTSLQAYGYFKGPRKRQGQQKLLGFTKSFEAEEDFEMEAGEEEEVQGRADLPVADTTIQVPGRSLTKIPEPPMDPRLRPQGRRVLQQMMNEDQNDAAIMLREEYPLAIDHRPSIAPVQSTPRSDPHEARIYSLDDFDPVDERDGCEVVPSSQVGENMSPLGHRHFSSRRSTEAGSSYRTMEPPGEETQEWWKNMADISRD